MRRRRGRRSPLSAIASIAVAAAAACLFGVGGREALAIDPCYGYDLCVHVNLQTFDISDGNGHVTSTPSGIDCRYHDGVADPTTVCDHYFHTNFATSITVTIHAVADAGSLASCGTYLAKEATCDSSETYSASVTTAFYATFRLAPTVSVTAIGAGVITSVPTGIQCTILAGSCSASWVSGSVVSLTASPAQGFVFAGWQGFCAGRSSTCSFTLQGNVDTTALFQSTAPPPTPTPVATPTPSSSPAPSASPIGAGPTPAPTSAAGASAQPGRPTSTPGTPGGTPGGAPGASSGPAGSGSDGPAASPVGTEGAVALVGGATAVPASGGGGAVIPTSTGNAPADLSPVIVAVLGAGVVVALAILGGAAMLRGRRREGPPG